MRFYGQWDPPVDKVIYEHFFKDKRDGFFIEAGAFDGLVESSCKMFEESLGWRGINMEPDPANYARLCINRPNSVNLQMALSDREGTTTFTRVIHPTMGEHFGNGSITHQANHRRLLQNEGCTFQECKIRTITYHDLLQLVPITKVDLMVLDVEGHELEVMNGMRGAPILPQVMCIEHGQLGIEAIEKGMREMGYTFQLTSANNAYYKKSGPDPERPGPLTTSP